MSTSTPSHPGSLTAAGAAALGLAVDQWERGCRSVLPHVPTARAHGNGWQPACDHCRVLDDETWLPTHDDREEAADDALTLLHEHVHGPLDPTDLIAY